MFTVMSCVHSYCTLYTNTVLEGGGVGELPDEGELLGGGPDGVADAGDLGAVDPLSCTQVIW